MNKTIYVHIGYPKTGTTTLQKDFFPYISEIEYLGINENDRYSSKLSKEVIDFILFGFGDLSKAADTLKPIIENKEKLILSHEEITYLALKKTMIKGSYQVIPFEDIAIRIKQLFNKLKIEIKILITIRKQEDIITSLYAQSYTHHYSLQSETKNFKRFLKLFLSNSAHPFKEVLNYDNLINVYSDIFGFTNLHVLIYEELVSSPEKFYKNLCGILDISSIKYSSIAIGKIRNKRTNEAKGYKNVKADSYFDKLNRFRHRYFGTAGKGILPRSTIRLLKQKKWNSNQDISKTIVLTDSERKHLEKIYRSSNMQLSSKFDLSLNLFQYFK